MYDKRKKMYTYGYVCGTRGAAELFLQYSWHILTFFVIYYCTDSQQDGI